MGTGGGHATTLVVDGVPQDGYGQDISAVSVWDADQVEVLRGPQSTKQGRSRWGRRASAMAMCLTLGAITRASIRDRTGENIDRQFLQEARANFETLLFGHQLKGVAGIYYQNAHYCGNDLFTVQYRMCWA